MSIICLYLDSEVLVLPPVMSSGLCFCWLPIFVDLSFPRRVSLSCFYKVNLQASWEYPSPLSKSYKLMTPKLIVAGGLS